jgi:hypothetical protein
MEMEKMADAGRRYSNTAVVHDTRGSAIPAIDKGGTK